MYGVCVWDVWDVSRVLVVDMCMGCDVCMCVCERESKEICNQTCNTECAVLCVHMHYQTHHHTTITPQHHNTTHTHTPTHTHTHRHNLGQVLFMNHRRSRLLAMNKFKNTPNSPCSGVSHMRIGILHGVQEKLQPHAYQLGKLWGGGAF